MGSFFKTDFGKLIISIVICQMAGIIGSIPNASSIPTWYAGLTKPSFNPPNWIFAPVWITLYLLMGVAVFLVWRQGLSNPPVKFALTLFILQLALNTAWTYLFFGLKSPLLAFSEILFLWVVIIAVILSFLKISIAAGLLLIPYILWVSFAVLLNFSIWRLN
ncbi:MAG: tryptophan-rich sensory protein [candidate division Zixibacteria bacterium]|nr:tryptophan-rich sensory protein [candidate division Zixibacteria bacterium]